MFCDMIDGVHVDLSVNLHSLQEKLGSSCQTVFIGVPVHPSARQQQVSNTLRDINLSVEDEFRCPKSGYSIDMRVHTMPVNAKSSTGDVEGWSVECVRLTFWEWDQLTGRDEREKYLRDKLHIS